MTCQHVCAVCCLLCSLFMTSSVSSRSHDSNSRVIPPVIIIAPNFHEYFNPRTTAIHLPCVATGTQPITYKWLRNGVPLAVSSQLHISNGNLSLIRPDKSMEGYFQCFASNDAGVAMSNVTFLQAAVIESSQTHRVRTTAVHRAVVAMDPVVLPCYHVSKCIPPPTYDWKSSKDGELFVLVQLDNRISITSNGSLVFNFIRTSDSALYKCSVYNRIINWATDGSRFNLTVVGENDESAAERKAYEPPVLLFSSPDRTIVEGDNLKLTCLFGSWPLGFEVEWRTPSREISGNGYSITIPDVSGPDAGIYTCRARKTMTNGSHLYSQTSRIAIQVDAIPSFVTFPTNQEIGFAQNASFACQGQGRPTPTASWYLNGTSLDEVNGDSVRHVTYVEGQTSVLILSDVRTTGTVTCNISNVHSYRLHTATIILAPDSVYDITSTSSQSQVIQTWKTTTESSNTTTSTVINTRTYHQLNTDPTFDSTTNGHSRYNYSGKPAEFLPSQSSLLSESITNKTWASIGVVVVACVIAIVVVVIVYIRQRRRRREPTVVLRERRYLEYRPEHLNQNVNHDRVYSDSDDSGFDDVRADNNERRNLRQP